MFRNLIAPSRTLRNARRPSATLHFLHRRERKSPEETKTAKAIQLTIIIFRRDSIVYYFRDTPPVLIYNNDRITHRTNNPTYPRDGGRGVRNYYKTYFKILIKWYC